MPRICPVYVPDMSRTINRAGHIWSIYGANRGKTGIRIHLSLIKKARNEVSEIRLVELSDALDVPVLKAKRYVSICLFPF